MRTIYKNGFVGLARRTGYFAYLESRSLLTPERGLPDEGPEIVPAGWDEAGAIHLGFSAVVRDQFIREASATVGFGEPRPEDAGWRSDRRAALQRLFAAMPTYRIDLYVARSSLRVEALRPDFQRGGWFGVRAVEAAEIDSAFPLFAVVTGPDGEPRPAHVLRIDRVDGDVKRRLRRIFSLDHIGYWGDEEPDPEPAPETPPSVGPARFGKKLPADAFVVFGGARREVAGRMESTRSLFSRDETVDPQSRFVPPLLEEN